MNTKTIDDKNTKLSEKVKNILKEKGFSFLFNFQDYKFFKQKAKGDFNPALKIADLFIQDTNQESDFNQYIF
jgi:ABC-type uncharacterized transport system substrate-binding protein